MPITTVPLPNPGDRGRQMLAAGKRCLARARDVRAGRTQTQLLYSRQLSPHRLSYSAAFAFARACCSAGELELPLPAGGSR